MAHCLAGDGHEEAWKAAAGGDDGAENVNSLLITFYNVEN